MWRVHRLDQISARKPAKLLDSRSLTLSFSHQQIWPVFLPYTAKLCINGHEYAKQQLAKKNIGFEALDNGVLSCDDPKRLQAICDGLSAEKIDAPLRKWLRLLPHLYSAADRKAGYRYQVSILQAEFSLTQVLDRPVTGLVFFEEVIRENLISVGPVRCS
jgi:hypothetical protein